MQTDGTDHSSAGLGQLVRSADPDRFFATLFAPAERREDLFALHAFDAEVAAIRSRISEPMPGEIRLQWWRDELDSIYGGRVRGIPVADGLTAAVAAHRLPRASFEAYLEARTFDLYDDPMPSLNDLEGYLGETESAVIQLSALVLGGSDAAQAGEISGHAGVAIGLARVLTRLQSEPWRVSYLPRDTRKGLGLDDRADAVLSQDAVVSLRGELARHALKRADLAAAGFSDLAPDLRSRLLPAYLPLAPARLDLNRLASTRPAVSPVALWRRMLSLYFSARRGRI